MKKLDVPQINTKVYWNYIYGDVWKRAQYDSQGTLIKPGWVGDKAIRPTARFKTATSYVREKDRVIDIGCGVGTFTKMVKRAHPASEVWGVDISDKAIEDNKKENPDIKYYQGYIERLDFLPSDYFDLAFAGEVIEHINEPPVLFQAAHRMLKKGGKLIITTPIEDHVFSEEHVWEFNRVDVETLYRDAGFKKAKFVDLPDMEHLIVFFAVGEK